MKLTDRMICVRNTVNEELSDFFKNKRKEALLLDPEAVELVDQIRDFTLRGGKRTRAFLVWLGHKTKPNDKCQMINDKLPKDLISLMMAVELFQSFALIHDDILDEDEERRGGPTVHQYFNDKCQMTNDKCKDSKHFGESMAILAGDLVFSWATELIDRAENVEAQKIFNQMAGETILGQSLDVMRGQTGINIDKSKIDKLKTAYYSVVRPLELGAALAGDGRKSLAPLEKYGLAVGLAYQLRDNLLDREITETAFETEKKEYLEKIDLLAGQIKTDIEIRKLLVEFALFVVTRSI